MSEPKVNKATLKIINGNVNSMLEDLGIDQNNGPEGAYITAAPTRLSEPKIRQINPTSQEVTQSFFAPINFYFFS